MELVVSTAIPADHPELDGRAAAGAPIIHRRSCSPRSPRCAALIAVSGTHGKTTTAAMIAHVLSAAASTRVT